VAQLARHQAEAAQETARAEVPGAGDDIRATQTTDAATQVAVADAGDLAAKLAAVTGSTPTTARVGVDPKAVQRADARQAAAKATAPAATPVGAGGAITPSVLTAVEAPGASISDAKQRTGDRPAAAHALTPSIAIQAHPSTFEGALRATSMDSAATRTGAAGAGTISSAASDRAFVDQGVPQQIVQAIRMQWNQGVGTARVTLQPDYLGNLTIDIKVNNGAVTAVLDASNATVRQWLEGHEPMLRQALADQGLTLDRLVVSDEQPSSSNAEDEAGQGQQGQQEQPRRRRQRGTPTDQAFEVLM
jgi:flagellar hook-length control protein FliK